MLGDVYKRQVYMKKMIVEQLVADLADTMKAQEPEKEAHKKKN